jgi:hypothetical protein
MELNTTNLMPKNSKIFRCEKCDFTCFKKSLYEKHLLTKKHNTTNTTKIQHKKFHLCECGKKYNHRSSLFNHKKVCDYTIIDTKKSSEQSEPIVEYLLKENIEMKKMLIDVCQKLEPISNVVSNVNSNNVFNINVFLNEQCKDAMNITEFIESIQLNVQDMMKIADDGQTKGMSNILIDKLNSIDVFKRPMHCSDVKNETIYIKDENKWEKEEKDKPKLKNVLDKLTKKSIDAMPCMDDDPDAYVKTISEVLKDPRQDKKIISNIAKEVSIE